MARSFIGSEACLLGSGFLDGLYEFLAAQPDFVVRIRVGECDRARGVNHEDGGHGKDVVLLAGRGFEVDSESVSIHCERLVIQPERNPKPPHGLRRGVRKDGVARLHLVHRLLELAGGIGTHRDDLESLVPDLSLHLRQLLEVRVAIRAPSASVEDQDRFLALENILEQGFVPVQIDELGIRGFNSRLEGLGFRGGCHNRWEFVRFHSK